MKRIFLLVLMVTALLIQPIRAEEAKIGVLAFRGELKAMTRWGAFGEYLTDTVKQPVTIVPYAPHALVESVIKKQADFALTNPVQSAILIEKYHCKPLLTLKLKDGSYFAGVILTKKGSGIHTGEDLRGKHVMCLDPEKAAGAYMFQAYHLYKKGIDPHKDFASLTVGKAQDDLVYAVLRGFTDAAFVRSGLLETMQREGKIDIDDFIIVDKQEDPNFTLIHSTALYPEWCLTTLPDTDPELVQAISRAALSLPPDSKAAEQARIVGFVDALPLDIMIKTLKALKVPPFDVE